MPWQEEAPYGRSHAKTIASRRSAHSLDHRRSGLRWRFRFRHCRDCNPALKMFCLAPFPAFLMCILHNPVLAYENGRRLPEISGIRRKRASSIRSCWWLKAPFRMRRSRRKATGRRLGTDPNTGQPITTNEWIDRLAPKALAVVACGTCATYGGIHAMEGNPTGAMGLADYLGWDWKSKAGLPIVNVPGCPVQPDNFMETLLYLLYQVAGLAPMIPLDDQLRPTWLFGKTVHEGCDRAGYYEQGDFAEVYGSPKCIVKLGCWGPVVNCNVPKRGWMAGIGGCPNVGGICIGCTMPGFPDKFMPFMDEPPGARVSTAGIGALRPRHSRPAFHDQRHRQQRTEVAASGCGTDHRLSPEIVLTAENPPRR